MKLAVAPGDKHAMTRVRTPRVLVVEDEAAMADSLIYVLRNDGFSTDHVRDQIAVFKALGGGWRSPERKPSARTSD